MVILSKKCIVTYTAPCKNDGILVRCVLYPDATRSEPTWLESSTASGLAGSASASSMQQSESSCTSSALPQLGAAKLTRQTSPSLDASNWT